MDDRSRAIPLILLGLLLADAAGAADLTSTSYRLRGSHVSAAATATLSSPSFLGTVSAGQSEALGFSGSASDLRTHASGFMPILAGALPSLDSDGDGIAFYLDDDDDGDGLLDIVETNTGFFTSASDTGTDSLEADTDGDGFDDGLEVASGSDPTNFLSTPAVDSVPALKDSIVLVLIVVMLASSIVLTRRPRRRS